MHKALWVGLVVGSVGAAVLTTWTVARQDLHRCVVEETLAPVASLLQEHVRIIDGLKRDGSMETESGLLESYLARIRQDGAAKNSAMKQRIDALVNDDTVIVALLTKYSSHARTTAFSTAAEEYRNYAIAFRDRWQSVFEIFMAGGNLPAAAPVYPVRLASSIEQELRAQ